jgi:hypothetical protein
VLGDRLTIRTPLSPEEVSTRLNTVLGRDGWFSDPKDEEGRQFVGRADQRGFHFRRRRGPFASRQRPTMRGSIREDPAGGSVIRTYYLADVWLRVSLVLFAVAFWMFVGTRFGTAELVYIALVVLILFGANQMYKSGNRELLFAAIDRPAGTSAPERR